MKQITFTITKEEVRNLTEEKLSHRQVEEILATVENDSILWDEIEESIKSAVQVALCKA